MSNAFARLPLFWAFFTAAAPPFATACSSHAAADKAEVAPRGATATATGGLRRTANGWIFSTGAVTVKPGEERYVCYAATMDEDLAVGRFSSEKNVMVHHFLLVETVSPEQEGQYPCDVLFRPTWAPMYAATTADATVEIPEGAAKIIPKGRQVLLQAHVLNTSSEPITRSVEVSLEQSRLEHPEKVGIMLFGAANIHLPPERVTTVENRCTVNRDVRLYAVLPHMHYLGQRLELDFGPDDKSQTPAYVRDPFRFDDQYFDNLKLTIPSGSVVHTRCAFDNDSDQTVTFGESARDEMCFAVGFNVGSEDLELCTETVASPEGGVPRAPDAGVCEEAPGTGGIGRLCSAGGTECGSGLFCSADLLNVTTGLCFQAGCMSNGDCAGTTCCTLPIVGSVANVCLPEACRPDFCIPVSSVR